MKINKTIIITGGTGFIGTHLCQRLINEGYKIICFSRSKKQISVLKNRLGNIAFKNLYSYIFDINNEEEIQRCAVKIREEHKKIDVLINNAAKRCEEGNFKFINKKQWIDVLEVNVVTPFLLSRAFVDLMPKYSSIINIGSIYGVTSTDLSIYEEKSAMLGFNTVYGVSKAALIHLTKYLATAFGEKQIRVNCVSLGGVRNPQATSKNFNKKYSSKIPMNRMAELEDLDGIISFLISDKSHYITGENILIDGGWSLY